MSNATLLSHHLTASSCRTATQLLQAAVEGLAKDGIKLEPEIKDAVKAVEAAGEAIVAGNGGDIVLSAERGVSHVVSALHDTLEAIENAFDDGDALPLSAAEVIRHASVHALLGTLFPSGTSYLREARLKRWPALRALGEALEAARKATDTLGLAAEADRVARFISFYGATIGVTQLRAVTPDAQALAIANWHDAWATFEVATRHVYRDKAKAPHASAVRAALLAPYQQMVEAERENDAKRRRAEKKKSKTPTPVTPTPPAA